MADKPKNMNDIFEKINDLKSVFKIGEKILPILQSLIDFMGDVVPLLENINSSIADSTNQMPKAANQISDVTSATELATNEILDLVDEITNELHDIDQSINNMLEIQKERDEKFEKIISLVKDNEEVVGLLHEYKNISTFTDSFGIIREVLAKINDDTFKITMSLQVQDITSQQLAAVNHLISSVNDRLSNLVNDIKSSDLQLELSKVDWDLPEKATFDGNASYTDTEGKQEAVDKIVANNNNQERASQEEIDKLFRRELWKT